MKYYIIAGEASGDLHGSNLMKSIYQEDPNAEIRFWGGDLMQNVGGVLVKHFKDLAFMGFVEVLMNLKTIMKNLSFCKNDIQSFSPDVIIYVDYPGFNLRIAKWAKQQGYKNHYYISPQIWAWKENRIHDIKRDIDKMYVILPFEKDFYQNKHHFQVDYVGHPLIDAIKQRPLVSKDDFCSQNNLPNKPIIAVLPGSRKQEIHAMLALMLSVASDFPDYQFVIAGAPSQPSSVYLPFVNDQNISLVENKTYDLLQNATAALVTSGTATLETALYKVPEVVLYKGNWISYQIAKRVITLKYISLVNLIMDKLVVTELIQNDCNKDNIGKELNKILDENHRKIILNDYQQLHEILGQNSASHNTATLIKKYLS